jgi:hypothetical protein
MVQQSISMILGTVLGTIGIAPTVVLHVVALIAVVVFAVLTVLVFTMLEKKR